jgi:hypothetical protein
MWREDSNLQWETIRALLIVIVWTGSLILVSVSLTGCSEAKYIECLARDNTRNPCN